MKRIFISRNLKSSSPIRNIIGENQLVDQSLIQFSALDFEIPQADWIFFYSRNGVKYFFENGNYELYPFLWACMSDGTADELSTYVTDISFIGQGSPQEVAQLYKNTVRPGEVTCFVRAENSLDSINKHLNNTDDFSIPVYRNIPTEDIPEGGFDILIFTSPMNVDIWFEHHQYRNENVIAIGSTTANQLTNSHDIKNVVVADNPSELSIAECLQSLL